MTDTSTKRGGGTLQPQIIKMMEEKAKPTELWTVTDVMDEMGLTKVQADNAMANAWKSNKICRHRLNGDPDSGYGGFARYAIKIKEADKQIYSAKPRGPNSTPPSAKKRKGQKASSKEIRMAFVDMQRALTRLEDLIMPVIESSEETDKALARLKNIL